MSKQYMIVNKNDLDYENTNYDSNSDIFCTLLILICVIAAIVFISNYYLNYKINITTILIILIVILLCKYILD